MSESTSSSAASTTVKSFFGGMTGTLGVVIALVLLLCCCCSALMVVIAMNYQPPATPYSIDQDEEEDVNTDIVEDTDIPEEYIEDTPIDEPDTTQIFTKGEVIELGDLQLIVNGTEDNYNTGNEYLAPQSGYKFYAVDVKITNTGNTPLYVSDSGFSLKDSEDYSYNPYWLAPKEPGLDSSTLNNGESIRGWITFEVTSTATGLKLVYAPNFWESAKVIVEL